MIFPENFVFVFAKLFAPLFARTTVLVFAEALDVVYVLSVMF